MIRVVTAAVITLSICVVYAESRVTPAELCEGMKMEDLHERVEIKPGCGKSRCKFRKGTNATIALRFKPTREIKQLTLDVYGILGDAHLPFIGVTGSSACKDVIDVATGDPAPCPLSPDQEYSYTRSFPIEHYYPSMSVRVHWGLKDDKGDVFCFELPVVIK